MRRLKSYYLDHQQGMTVFGLIATATIFCLVLVRIQMLQNRPSPSAYYTFMVRNILLAWIPLLIGVISLCMMHRIARREYSPVAGWIFVFCAFMLASSGIYLGRFYHVNS
jgi:uncharacterized membrane protein